MSGLHDTIRVRVNAQDDVAVKRVDLLLDGNQVDTKTSPPWDFDFSTLSIPDGTHTVSARATDLAGNSTTSPGTNITLNNSAPLPLAITTTVLPGPNIAQQYSATINASGGSRTGFTWSIVSGSLPSGLTLRTTGTPATILEGTTNVEGGFDFTVRVTDSLGATDDQVFHIDVVGADIPFIDSSIAGPNTPFGPVWGWKSTATIGQHLVSRIRVRFGDQPFIPNILVEALSGQAFNFVDVGGVGPNQAYWEVQLVDFSFAIFFGGPLLGEYYFEVSTGASTISAQNPPNGRPVQASGLGSWRFTFGVTDSDGDTASLPLTMLVSY